MVILLILLTVSLAYSQIFTTVPNTDNGPGYVFAEEGTLNVSLYCMIYNNGLVQTRWLVKRQSDNNLVIPDFNSAGELISPANLLGKITAIGDVIPGISLTYETNFTILNFTNEFDMAQVDCAQSFPGTSREFNLGFPGNISTPFFIIFYLHISSSISINSC